MAIAVVGFDLGFQSCYTAAARAGGIETIANEYSDRCTPSYLGFSSTTRFQGHAARQQMITNMRSTVHGFTKLLGKDFENPLVQAELPYAPFKMVKTAAGTAGVEVMYLNEPVTFTIEQCMAMMLTKLKHIAETNLGTPVIDCVVNVPSYFNDRERRAMLDATQIAGLNCLKLINDITAIGLNYGIYKKDLPPQGQEARRIAFVDLGHCDLQVGIIAFNEGQMKVLSTACDPSLGGRDMDRVIFNHFVEDFDQRYKLDVRSNQKAQLKLLEECQRLRKLMSANSTAIPLNIECFMNDKDVQGKMKREQFHELLKVAGILTRIEDCLRQALTNAKLQAGDIHSVEIVGGTTRVPIVKQLIANVYKQEARTTLNADEAVARGCALQCAILSPAFKVRDFSIQDWHPYSISLSYLDPAQDKEDALEIFPQGHQYPFSKALTFYRSNAFDLSAFYTDQHAVPPSDRMIGKFRIANVQPQSDGSNAKIKVKVRVNSHGIFTVCQARASEIVEKQEEETPAATEEVKTESPEVAESNETTEAAEVPAETENGNVQMNDESSSKKDATPTKKTKKVVKYTDLPIETFGIRQLVKKEMMDCQDKEGQMVMQEVQEKDRSNAKNAVEEYVYEMRDRLYGVLDGFVTDEEREKMSSELTATEDWLYGEGENLGKQAYNDRLAGLRKKGDIYHTRAKEATERPQAAEELGHVFQHASKIYDAWQQQDENYSHLTTEEMSKVAKAVEEKRQWFITQMNAQNNLRPTDDPILTAAQIQSQKGSLEAVVTPILNKPKPKPKVEEPPKPNGEEAKENGDATQTKGNDQSKGAEVNGEVPQKEADMDLD